MKTEYLFLSITLFTLYMGFIAVLITPTQAEPIAPSQTKPILDGQNTLLCCLLEDAPESALQGQAYTFAALINPQPVTQPKPAASKPKRATAPKPVVSSPAKTPQKPHIPVSTSPSTDFGQIINNLKKIQARKLCKPLGIQQKRNGVELTAELMKAEIRRRFKADPDLVIAAIQERLPEVYLDVEPEVLAS